MSRTKRERSYGKERKLRELRRQGEKYEVRLKRQASEPMEYEATPEDDPSEMFYCFAIRTIRRSVLDNLTGKDRAVCRLRLRAIQDMGMEQLLDDRTMCSIYEAWLEGSHAYARTEIAHWFFAGGSVK